MRSREENLARLREEAREITPGQKFEIRDFEPEDAPGVAALFYAVYGESFPVDSVYDPEQIAQANASRQVHHVVARTLSGEVIGLHAYFRNPPGRHIMELGSWMVLPAYRNTTLAVRLAQRAVGNPPAHLDLHVIFTQNVCNHLISQKMAVKYNFLSCALELEAMPPGDEDAGGGSAGRISLIGAFMLLRDAPHAVRLPGAYAPTLRRMYASRGLSREFVDDGQPRGETRSAAQSMDAASLARLTVSAIGQDIAAHIGRFGQDHPDRHVLQLALPLWQPGATLAVQAARDAGFFLAGLLPLWDDRDMLLLQKLRTEPDYSLIQLHTDEARELLELIVADRASLGA